MGKKIFIATPKKIESDLLACKIAFEKVGVPWVIIGGVILGYARYKAIMEWDTDLDIAIFVELTKQRWTELYNSLHESGFLKVKKVKLDYQIGTRETLLNIQLYHKRDNFYESYPRSMSGFKYVEKAEWYDKPQMKKFLGNYYPMPNHIDDYVSCHYGKDWKTNIVKNHEEYYLDKRGARGIKNSSMWLTSRGGKHGDLWPKILRRKDTMKENNEI